MGNLGHCQLTHTASGFGGSGGADSVSVASSSSWWGSSRAVVVSTCWASTAIGSLPGNKTHKIIFIILFWSAIAALTCTCTSMRKRPRGDKKTDEVVGTLIQWNLITLSYSICAHCYNLHGKLLRSCVD